MSIALQMTGINKSYSGVRVLIDVDFEVREGEIHALLGENGAGKTTLMNILGGVVAMDSGRIQLFGNDVTIQNTHEANQLGIAFIHQELNVVNDLMVYENLFLGRELRTSWGGLNTDEMRRRSTEVFKKMGVDIDPRAMMRSFDASHKQIVEIAKSILFDARLIIMDEPTSSLTRAETEKVFAIMKDLTKNHGATVIFISHKLGEVCEFCDRFTILRNGEKVASGDARLNDGACVNQVELAKLMVGHDALGTQHYEAREIGDPVLEVVGLDLPGKYNNISFTLHKGEILGFTGLLGDGKLALVHTLFGDMVARSGEVFLNGEKISITHPSLARKRGIGFLPPNRKENAIIKDMNVRENMTITTLRNYVRRLSLSKKRENDIATDYSKRIGIRMRNLSQPITTLSGGNQQKAVISKWLLAKPEIMILCNPTQGVDVGAKNEIYALITELANQGVSIIVTSDEAQEVMRICDRVIVMYHGVIQGELTHEEITEEAIMILSTGGVLAVG